jgi:hypothetical protein
MAVAISPRAAATMAARLNPRLGPVAIDDMACPHLCQDLGTTMIFHG